jgi:Protein of unknown function (DUF3570)
MRKISLMALAFIIGVSAAFAQEKPATPASFSLQNTIKGKPKTHQTGTDSLYLYKPISFEEANITSGYYRQSGNHAAVTGGLGSEKLTDFANNLDFKFSGVTKKGIKHTLGLDIGIDYYTSASSDKIDPRNQGKGGGGNQTIDSALLYSAATRTSASYADQRFYPSVSWAVNNPKKKTTFSLGASFSTEWDYQSRGLSASFGKGSKNGMRELNIRGAAYLDAWSMILPAELRVNTGGDDDDDDNYIKNPRNTFETSLSFMQVVNRRLHLMLTADLAYQQGYLATSFNRVFFADGSLKAENLPGSKMKTPIGIRANYFAGDKVIIRSFYRFYRDDWGMQAHTASIELPFKTKNNISITPSYRYHMQQGIDYFAGYRQHAATDTYFTSDYDLSGFHSHFMGLGMRYSPSKRTLIPMFNQLEVRTGYYLRSDGLNSWILSLHMRFK